MIMSTGTRISEGNRKMGTVPSVSLLPVATCAPDVPCKTECYVVRNMLRGPHAEAVRKAYSANTVLAKGDPEQYWQGITEYLQRRKPERFRYHVSGDMLSVDYLRNMVAVAERFPATRFLAFTKRFDLVASYKESGGMFPANLCIRLSQWYGRTSTLALPRAWFVDVSRAFDSRFDAEYDALAAQGIVCAGSCAECSLCWDNSVRDIAFHRH